MKMPGGTRFWRLPGILLFYNNVLFVDAESIVGIHSMLMDIQTI